MNLINLIKRKGKKDKEDKKDKKDKKKDEDGNDSDSSDDGEGVSLPPLGMCGKSDLDDASTDIFLPKDPIGDMSIPEVEQFFSKFYEILSAVPDTPTKRNSLKQLRSMTPSIAERNTTVTVASLDDTFSPSFAVQTFLKRVLEADAPQRARLAVALHRFCTELGQELEDEVFSSGTGFLAGLRNDKALTPTGSSAGTSPTVASIPPCRDLDLPRIYQQLLQYPAQLPTAEELREIFVRSAKQLRGLPNVVMVPLPATVVGDIHGQARDLLQHVLREGGALVPESALKKAPEDASASAPAESPQRSYLFLGDYVDRGSSSLHCLSLLLVAQLLSPNTVFLLRGNHESRLTNRHYGFLEECHRYYPIVHGRVTTSPGVCSQKQAGGGGAAAAPGSASSLDDTSQTRRSPRSSHHESAAAEDHAEPPPQDPSADWDLTDHPLWCAANDVFLCLPLGAALYKTVPASGEAGGEAAPAKQEVLVYAMHGGLSPFIENSIDSIIAVNRFREIEGGALADLTWSDPIVGPTKTPMTAAGYTGDAAGESSPTLPTPDEARSPSVATDIPPPYTGPPIGYTFSSRGTGHNFGEDATVAFLRTNKGRYIIRAHQCVQEGYQWCHQGRLVTLFSAPNYCGMGNKGAILLLDEEVAPKFVQYQFASDDEAASVVAPQPPVPPREFTD